MQINQRKVKALRPPARGNRVFYDDEISGFGVRITAAGVISFVLNYWIAGRERRYTIGRWPEWSADAARNEAIDLRKNIREGRDPLGEKERRRLEPKITDLAADYIERYALPHKRAASVRADRGMLDKIILPNLGKLHVAAVKRRDIESLHQALRQTPVHANRVLSLLSRMFSLAINWNWCAENPVRGIKHYHEDRREVWLKLEQLEHLIRALAAYPDVEVADAILLLIVTGAREAEVLSAEWPQFDLERGVWIKSSHHTKQRKTEHVPLSEAALHILHRIAARKTGSPYLFPGRYRDKARVTLRRPWVQICKAAGLACEQRIQGKRRELFRYKPLIRIHDLRHTFASHLVSQGESLHVVGRLLGHVRSETTARYAHVADHALRNATNRFGEMLKVSDAITIQSRRWNADGEQVLALTSKPSEG
jgi:integrase